MASLPMVMQVGNPGNGSPYFPGELYNNMSHAEQTAHFSLWAAFKSPLVIGADPRTLSTAALSILQVCLLREEKRAQ